MITRAIISAIISAIVIATATTASADEPRKRAPDKFVRAAGEAFKEAVAADEAGDLATAMGLYTKAFEISPHPNTVFNMADVQRRLGQLVPAIRSYETYLALAPNASDRRAVEATLAQLRATPGVLVISTPPASDPSAIKFEDAYILVDGAIVKRPGVAPTIGAGEVLGVYLDVAPGEHRVDVVTELSYGEQVCKVAPGARQRCFVRAPPRTDGGMVVSADARSGLSLQLEPRTRSAITTRFPPPPAPRLMLRDRSYECPALVLAMPRGNEVSYTYLATSGYDRVKRCRPITITRHKLKFAPVAGR